MTLTWSRSENGSSESMLKRLCLDISPTTKQKSSKLHGKRRIEHHLFFQPLQVHFPCVFSGFSAFVHFLDPLKSCDKLLRFINAVSVSVYFSYHKLCRTWVKFWYTSLGLEEGVQILYNHCLIKVSISGCILDPKFPLSLLRKVDPMHSFNPLQCRSMHWVPMINGIVVNEFT